MKLTIEQKRKFCKAIVETKGFCNKASELSCISPDCRDPTSCPIRAAVMLEYSHIENADESGCGFDFAVAASKEFLKDTSQKEFEF